MPPETDSGQHSPPPNRPGWLSRLASTPTPLIFAISVGVAVALLWRQGSFGDVAAAARRADGWTVAAALALYLAGLALLCVRWHLVVRMIAGASSLPRASEAFLTSVVINYAAPIGLAVPTRAALTKRALGLNVGQTGAVALWEIALDVAVLGLATLVWLILSRADLGEMGAPSGGQLLSLAILIVVGLTALLLTALIVRRKRQWQRIRAAIKRTALYPRQRPTAAVHAIATTLVYWLGQAAVLWLLLAALTDDVSLSLALGLVSLPVLVGMLSPVPGGAGIREALMLAVARVHDADTAAVLLAALTYRIALFAAIPVLYLGVRLWLTARGEPPVPPEISPAAPGHGTITASAAPPNERRGE